MAYRLEDREGMASGMRRILAEELDSATFGLRARPLPDEAVHEARKSLKKARSALRLVRSDLGDDVRKRENAEMRDAARRLSGARDAQVMLETLDKLASDRSVAVPAPAVARLRQLLQARRDELLDESDLEAEAAAAVEQLAAVRERLDEWPLSDEGFGAAGAGLQRMHRRGRQAMDAALQKGEDELWHEWRKRVKDLWYALRILKPVAPGQLSGATDEASDLSDVLGDHNDLVVLAETVSGYERELASAHVELLHAAVSRRRHTLRLAAVPLGMRLYAERPRALVRRLESCWHARDSQAAADAHWMPPELVSQVRAVLEERQSASPAEARKLSATLPWLGFRIGDFQEHVVSHGAGFSVEDFDSLVQRGIVRVGSPPPPGLPSKRKNGASAGPPEPSPKPEASAPPEESPPPEESSPPEAPSPEAPSNQASPTPAPSTQAPSSRRSSTQTPPPQAPPRPKPQVPREPRRPQPPATAIARPWSRAPLPTGQVMHAVRMAAAAARWARRRARFSPRIRRFGRRSASGRLPPGRPWSG